MNNGLTRKSRALGDLRSMLIPLKVRNSYALSCALALIGVSAMVKTVLEHEHFLLSRHELDALDNFSKFCCRNTLTIHYISLIENLF